jgi:hypothetical protein
MANPAVWAVGVGTFATMAGAKVGNHLKEWPHALFTKAVRRARAA